MEYMKGKAAVWFLLANIIITLALLFFTLKIFVISPKDYKYSSKFGLALFILNCLIYYFHIIILVYLLHI